MIDLTRRSPHHNSRPPGVEPSLIVLHADASAHEHGTLSWLEHPESKVSYHYLVGRDGHIWQLVATHERAWHAGKSSFCGVPDCNDYSIGASLSNLNDGAEEYPEPQLAAGADLCALLMDSFPAITLARITTHRVVSPGRKTDPKPPAFGFDSFLARVASLRACHMPDQEED